MEEASRTPSFLIDIELWQKFNLELRAACHWCTHYHTTTPPRWFYRFCINRHLGVDLKNFFQLDEVQGKWIQIPNLCCWHCQARVGEAECINCPQKHTKRAKRARENPLPPTRSLLGPSSHSNVAGGVASVFLAAARDSDYDGVSSEGRGGPTNEAHNMDKSNFGVGETHVRLDLPMHASPVSDFRYV